MTFALMPDEAVNARLTALLEVLQGAADFHPRQVQDLLDETPCCALLTGAREACCSQS